MASVTLLILSTLSLFVDLSSSVCIPSGKQTAEAVKDCYPLDHAACKDKKGCMNAIYYNGVRWNREAIDWSAEPYKVGKKVNINDPNNRKMYWYSDADAEGLEKDEIKAYNTIPTGKYTNVLQKWQSAADLISIHINKKTGDVKAWTLTADTPSLKKGIALYERLKKKNLVFSTTFDKKTGFYDVDKFKAATTIKKRRLLSLNNSSQSNRSRNLLWIDLASRSQEPIPADPLFKGPSIGALLTYRRPRPLPVGAHGPLPAAIWGSTCTAWAIAPKFLATAAHCICKYPGIWKPFHEMKWFPGHNGATPNDPPNVASLIDTVHLPRSWITYNWCEGNREDWAIIELTANHGAASIGVASPVLAVPGTAANPYTLPQPNPFDPAGGAQRINLYWIGYPGDHKHNQMSNRRSPIPGFDWHRRQPACDYMSSKDAAEPGSSGAPWLSFENRHAFALIRGPYYNPANRAEYGTEGPEINEARFNTWCTILYQTYYYPNNPLCPNYLPDDNDDYVDLSRGAFPAHQLLWNNKYEGYEEYDAIHENEKVDSIQHVVHNKHHNHIHIIHDQPILTNVGIISLELYSFTLTTILIAICFCGCGVIVSFVLCKIYQIYHEEIENKL